MRVHGAQQYNVRVRAAMNSELAKSFQCVLHDLVSPPPPILLLFRSSRTGSNSTMDGLQGMTPVQQQDFMQHLEKQQVIRNRNKTKNPTYRTLAVRNSTQAVWDTRWVDLTWLPHRCNGLSGIQTISHCCRCSHGKKQERVTRWVANKPSSPAILSRIVRSSCMRQTGPIFVAIFKLRACALDVVVTRKVQRGTSTPGVNFHSPSAGEIFERALCATSSLRSLGSLSRTYWLLSSERHLR